MTPARRELDEHSYYVWLVTPLDRRPVREGSACRSRDRALFAAALAGELDQADYRPDESSGSGYDGGAGVDSRLLDPRADVADPEDTTRRRVLAEKFDETSRVRGRGHSLRDAGRDSRTGLRLSQRRRGRAP